MKVKNIAFSGFAAAILGGVCGATDANAIQLVSPEYVAKRLETKQNVLTEGAGIKIEGNVISSTVSTDGFATMQDVTEAIEDVTMAMDDYATTDYVDGQIQAVDAKIPTTVAELTDSENYALKSAVQTVADDVSALQGTVGNAELSTTAKTITAAINELKGKTDGLATEGNFTEVNNKITALEGLVGTEKVETQIQNATADLATKDELQGVKDTIPTTVAELTDADDYALKSGLPTKTSQLENDSGYVTSTTLNSYATMGDLQEVEGQIETLAGDIPTNVSDLENDSKYISGNGTAGNYIVHLDGNGNVTWKAVEVIGANGQDMLAE